MTAQVSINDLFGIFYVMKPPSIKWQSYYETINAITPLLNNKSFIELVSGFYLNVSGNFDALRISYFSKETNALDAVEFFRTYFSNKGIIETNSYQAPKKIILAQSYGGSSYEFRFRNFLNNETKVGIELLSGNLLHAQRLFAVFRWQTRKANLPFEELLEPSFKKYSPTFNSWTEKEKTEFFGDLKEWPVPNQVDWAHMMVNLILGADWNQYIIYPSYITPNEPLSFDQINEILRKSDIHFRIPMDWKFNKFE